MDLVRFQFFIVPLLSAQLMHFLRNNEIFVFGSTINYSDFDVRAPECSFDRIQFNDYDNRIFFLPSKCNFISTKMKIESEPRTWFSCGPCKANFKASQINLFIAENIEQTKERLYCIVVLTAMIQCPYIQMYSLTKEEGNISFITSLRVRRKKKHLSCGRVDWVLFWCCCFIRTKPYHKPIIVRRNSITLAICFHLIRTNWRSVVELTPQFDTKSRYIDRWTNARPTAINSTVGYCALQWQLMGWRCFEIRVDFWWLFCTVARNHFPRVWSLWEWS